jgi:hypothetical protein
VSDEAWRVQLTGIAPVYVPRKAAQRIRWGGVEAARGRAVRAVGVAKGELLARIVHEVV